MHKVGITKLKFYVTYANIHYIHMTSKFCKSKWKMSRRQEFKVNYVVDIVYYHVPLLGGHLKDKGIITACLKQNRCQTKTKTCRQQKTKENWTFLSLLNSPANERNSPPSNVTVSALIQLRRSQVRFSGKGQLRSPCIVRAEKGSQVGNLLDLSKSSLRNFTPIILYFQNPTSGIWSIIVLAASPVGSNLPKAPCKIKVEDKETFTFPNRQHFHLGFNWPRCDAIHTDALPKQCHEVEKWWELRSSLVWSLP